MKLVSRIAAAVAVAAALVPAANAQPVANDRFNQLDTNRDGMISRGEWDTAVQRGPTYYQHQHQQGLVVAPGAAVGATTPPPHHGYVSRDYPPRLVYEAPAPVTPSSRDWPPTTVYGPR